MIAIQFRPIAIWPGARTPFRKSSSFRASYNDTLALLDGELGKLKATAVIIQLALESNQIRQDGLPYANVRPSHPGVILSFQSKHGPLSYPCDTFQRWEDNLRAIALSLEHLRAVDRYGVTKRGEQYKGWNVLASSASEPTVSKVDALKFLQTFVSTTISNRDQAKDAYRTAVMKTHPDRGGDAQEFKRVQQAAEILGL